MTARLWWRHGDRLAFRCPGCDVTHEVAIEGPHAWGWNASDDALTLTPSVLVQWPVTPPRVCHSFVTNGAIRFLGDCTHALAGQTVPLPPFGNPYALPTPPEVSRTLAP